MSLGEDRVRVTFNPANVSLVDNIKQRAAALIDLCEEAKNSTPGTRERPEETRLWALAMTCFEDGAMWAVKAATTGK